MRLLPTVFILSGSTALAGTIQPEALTSRDTATASRPEVLSVRRDDAERSAPQRLNRRTVPDGVVAYEVTQARYLTTNTRIKRRQQLADTDVQVYNLSSISYLIELSIGTPGQSTFVAVDTGSSELWVNPDCQSAQSRQQAEECTANGSYNPDKSSSVTKTRRKGGVQYGIGEVEFQYVKDDISLPGSDINVKGVQFGSATRSQDLSLGILGLSFGKGYNMDYNSFVDELVGQNATQTRAFGVALGAKDEGEHSGLLTFGGIDTKKFSGKLHTSPILEPRADEEGLFRYWVTLDSVGLTDSVGTSKQYENSNVNVFFDTGATLSYLPRPVIQNIVADIGAQYSKVIGLYIVPCGLKGTIDFTFGNFTVNVALNEFIWQLEDGSTCALGADVSDEGAYLLGDSFLRSVYAVFDQDSAAIHFAHYVNCGSNLQTISAGLNKAAEFEGECTQKQLDDAIADSSSKGSGKDNAATGLSALGSVWLALGAGLIVQLIAS